MYATFYSVKNQKDIADPIVKSPGDVNGQVFDITSCENCTIIIMDHTEQIQIDECKNIKVFVGACASSIFIRNCENCTFYICSRQIRLREVSNTKLFTCPQGEVHVEYSNGLRFGPFNGGYPEQEKHFKAAKLRVDYNAWYDIYDHNDPDKTNQNWSLLPEEEYGEPWFPMGTPCTIYVPITKYGSSAKPKPEGDMQEFGMDQLKKDATKCPEPQINNTVVPPKLPSTEKSDTTATTILPPQIPEESNIATVNIPQGSSSLEEDIVKDRLKSFAEFKAGNNLLDIVTSDFILVSESGKIINSNIYSAAAPVVGSKIHSVANLKFSSDKEIAYSVFYLFDGLDESKVCPCSAVILFDKASCSWRLAQVQKSALVSIIDI